MIASNEMNGLNDRRVIKQGLVHVYTGTGKGKTTASLGLALRILGWGGRVCMVQFIKGYPDIGEAKFAAECGNRFIFKQFAIDLVRNVDATKASKRLQEVNNAFEWAEDTVVNGGYDLVILDEINNAMDLGLIDESQVIELIKKKPASLELVLTGRGAPESIIDIADYAVEIKSIKHPYEKGVPARKGIDY